MIDYWIKLSSKVKQSKKLRFNYIMNSLSSKSSDLEERIVALEDRLGYIVTLNETSGLTGVTVKLDSEDVTEIGEGVYSIEDVLPGTYTLSATKEGYVDYSEEITIDREHLTFDFSMETVPTFRIYGTVNDEDSSAIEGATVTIDDETATTDDTGAYEITGLVADTYTITVECEGYTTATDSVTISNADVEKGFNLTPVEN